jgi:hypothetical protein
MYAYGATATLVVSFALVTHAASTPIATTTAPPLRSGHAQSARYAGWLVTLSWRASLRSLTIVAGLVGTRNTATNISERCSAFFARLLSDGGDRRSVRGHQSVALAMCFISGWPRFGAHPLSEGPHYYPALTLRRVHLDPVDTQPRSLAVLLIYRQST